MKERAESKSVTPQTKNRSAFTLIELLVVIAIIALLVSILVPSLQQARELAKATLCLHNNKTIGTGMSLYQAEYNGYLPAEARWPAALLLGPYLQAGSYKCPSNGKLQDGAAAYIYYSNVNGSDGTVYPIAQDKAMFPLSSTYLNVGSGISYGWNFRGICEKASLAFTWGKLPIQSLRVRPGTILLAEVNNYRQERSAIAFSCADPPTSPYWPVFNARHRDKATVLFLDNHVQALTWFDLGTTNAAGLITWSTMLNYPFQPM